MEKYTVFGYTHTQRENQTVAEIKLEPVLVVQTCQEIRTTTLLAKRKASVVYTPRTAPHRQT